MASVFPTIYLIHLRKKKAMNLKGYCSVLALGISIATFGQNSKGDIELGVNSGINFSSVGNNEGNSDVSTAFNLSASADYFFSSRWSLKSKLIYDKKGWDNGFVENSSFDPSLQDSYKTNFNLNYLTIPVLASWHFGGKRNWYLHFGPYAGVLLNAKETTFDTKLTKVFNTMDFGASLGVGVKIPLSEKLKLSLEYDEQVGFLDIFKENSGSSITNSRTSFNIGLNFMLK